MSTQNIHLERFLKILQASPEAQVAIDQILDGKPKMRPGSDSGPTLMTFGQVAAFLSCSRATIYRLVAAGKLRRIYLLAGSPRISSADVDALVAGKQEDSP